MADVIRKATNRFTKGLVMDFSPENTKNEVLTHALNATLLTFNGNELSLQNDMGNARVETAYLPEGYMPVGTCEYGGIIYIVSYNPLEDKSQIGCFPSPERNVSSSELGISNKSISRESFQSFDNGKPTGDIVNASQYVLLKNDNLNPGDKFLVCTNPDIYDEKLSDLLIKTDDVFNPIDNPILALNVVSIEESGKIVYLNSDIKQYIKDHNGNTYKYHLLGDMTTDDGTTYNQTSVDPDAYRDVLNSGYSVFKSKTSGKLAILAELIMVDSYSVTHSVIPRKDNRGDVIAGMFDVVISTEVSPEVTSDNFNLVPKLQYYYLQNSQGYLQVEESAGKIQNLFTDSGVVDNKFLAVKLNEIFEPTIEEGINLNVALGNSGKFNFPKPGTYHGRMEDYEGDLDAVVENKVYTKFTEGKYHRVKKHQIIDNHLDYFVGETQAKFYYYDGNSKGYTEVTDGVIHESYTYYVKDTQYEYFDAKRDETYKHTELFKIASEPIIAPVEIIEDPSIEKFQYIDVITFRVATEDDGFEDVYIKNGDQYTQVSGESERDPNTTYYVKEQQQTLVSVGYEPYNGTFLYYPNEKNYTEPTQEELNGYWDFDNFPKKSDGSWGYPLVLYWRRPIETYKEATAEQLVNFKEQNITLYYNTDYVYIAPASMGLFNDSDFQLFMVVPMDTYVSSDKFVPNAQYNYIQGYDKPTSDSYYPSGGYPKDDPISLYTVASFIPSKKEEDDEIEINNYQDLKLANIKIPPVLSVNGIDLPFKYDYTLIPCMNYGRLDHLAVSNTVDFSKLHAFDQSDFTTWKYHIDDNQLRLTFGADVYDTYQDVKVDGLILEFYDAWGFAGSLEITDKKSYSGIFTKIITLNSVNALSKNRVRGSSYSSNFRRNINIQEDPDNPNTFIFNEKPIRFVDSEKGWCYVDGDKPLDDSDNDCGTLYSNIIYGVRAYFRKTHGKGTANEYREFIKAKKTFFLYTLPIYNDFYYTLSDFSNISNPQLNMMLTYKLEDKSTLSAYNKEGVITNGYNNTDYALVDSYLGGFCDLSSLNLVRYYKYTGTTNAYLEVGLMKEYEKVNLSYDPTINKKFSCKLRLLSDSDESSSFDVLSGIDGIVIPEQILNYNREGVYFQSKDINKLQFENGTEINVDQNTFVNSNFITSIGESPIKINYEFIVGYKVDISNIRNTQVPATTVCALCHKNIDGEYNYEDFGVYEQFVTQADGSTTSVYLSDAMFYNEGTADLEVFGICRQMKTSGENMLDECNPIATISTESQPIQTAGKLNSGDPLKQLVSNIGKLTFCQPHAHGLSEVNGVNIHEGNGTRNYGIPPDISGIWIDDDFLADTEYDQCGGINPRTFLFENPKYNLSLNTKNAINYNSEFLSTLDWNIITSEVRGDALEEGNRNWHSCKMREFTGFTGEDVAKFNKALVETMKNIYAYNPDYDQIDVNVGNIALQNYNPKFTSNLLSSDAKFTFGNTQTLNNFIYFGPILVSNYLKYLNLHSKTNDGEMIKVEEEVDGIKKPIPQLEFIPNFDYCGSSTNPYLISSLTYNTPVPASLESELEFSSSNIIVVKHSDGTNSFFEGRPNKKALYGYNKEYNKLIQLDVSNYKIDTNGVLTVSSDGAKETKSGSITVNAAASENLFKGAHEFEYTFTNDKGESEELKLSLYLSKSNASTLTYDSEGFFMGMEETGAYNDYFYIRPFLNVYKKDTTSPYSYSAKVVNMKLKGNTKVLNDKITLRTYGSYKNLPNLKDQTATILSSLISQTSQLVQPKYPSGSYSPVQSSTYWAYNGENYDIRANNTLISYSNVTVEPDDNGQFKISFVKSSDLVDDWEFTTRLIKILIQEVNFEVVQTSKLEATTESFLGSTKTTKYFNRDNNKYTVLTKFKDARFRGTSLTINDLVYEPSKDGHRLFVKNNCCIYNSSYRGKLYYRFLNGGNDKSHGSWDYSDTKNLNTLFLFTGPCFTSDNI